MPQSYPQLEAPPVVLQLPAPPSPALMVQVDASNAMPAVNESTQSPEPFGIGQPSQLEAPPPVLLLPAPPSRALVVRDDRSELAELKRKRPKKDAVPTYDGDEYDGEEWPSWKFRGLDDLPALPAPPQVPPLPAPARVPLLAAPPVATSSISSSSGASSSSSSERRRSTSSVESPEPKNLGIPEGPSLPQPSEGPGPLVWRNSASSGRSGPKRMGVDPSSCSGEDPGDQEMPMRRPPTRACPSGVSSESEDEAPGDRGEGQHKRSRYTVCAAQSNPPTSSKRKPPNKIYRGAGTHMDLWLDKLTREYEEYRHAPTVVRRK